MPEPATERAPARIRGRERLPDAVASLVEDTCAPCHFAGGEVVDMLDLSDADTILRRAVLVEERVSSGDMPPDAPLPAEQATVIRAWAEAEAQRRAATP